MLHHLIELVVPNIIYLLELFGVFIITLTAIKCFIRYAMRGFDLSDDVIKIELARALSLGLTFLLGGEILSTMFAKDLKQIYVIVGIVVIRVAITYVLHWEISSDMDHCNSFATLKERVACRQDVLQQKLENKH
ncbi:DUF1622 domain-containing protein [Alkaliphilus oremlandii]|uniref:DUF1622 domain-containing protein n=1 Tax=Alkaliphilus oremlandii (strain OhILAs) TaxID=350688 RepID=A8MIN7_ALKOO|nr:DUF1622 domain-containing protein [Alkaliphilus oremlandii]ABW19669.1 hypothetical protein Clos_2133 [Alkaliphilus oremlandii OhILAs]